MQFTLMLNQRDVYKLSADSKRSFRWIDLPSLGPTQSVSPEPKGMGSSGALDVISNGENQPNEE